MTIFRKKSSLLGSTEYACLSHCSMAIMRHHAKSNSYFKKTKQQQQKKCLIGSWLTVSEV